MTQSEHNDQRPFYFIVTFWGEAYREHFMRLCLPSMLAPGNIPALARPGNRFLISTSEEDWAAIQDNPTFKRMRQCIEPVFLPLRYVPQPHLHDLVRTLQAKRGGATPDRDGEPVVSASEILTDGAFAELLAVANAHGGTVDRYGVNIHAMSQGHKHAAQMAYADHAYGVFLAPDMVLSDGSVAALDRLASDGKQVVLAAANRFTYGCVEELESRGLMAPGKPLVLAPRDLVETAFRHFHPETAAFEWCSPYFCDVPTSSFWRVPSDDGGLMHSFFWAPLLVDYAAIEQHDTGYLDIGGTTDGRYVALHFTNHDAIHVVTDSDEILLVSFTDESEYGYPVSTAWYKSCRPVANIYKALNLHLTLYGPMGDDLKRRYYPIPVRFHSRDVTPAWDAVEKMAAALIGRSLTPPGPVQRLLLPLVRSRRPDRVNLPRLSSRVIAAGSWIVSAIIWVVGRVWRLDRAQLKWIAANPRHMARRALQKLGGRQF